jgi:hypothetical protein
MANYCSSSDIKADIPDSPLASTTDTTYDTAIDNFITAASRLIDKEVGREAVRHGTLTGRERLLKRLTNSTP